MLARALGQGGGGYDALARPQRLGYEAVGRHLALLMDSDEADPARAEEMWHGWRRDKGGEAAHA
jgi:hypothetical protein